MSHQKTRRVLIVEDNPQVSEVLAAFLEQFGCTIAGISQSGEDAVQRIRDDHPDLVFIDIVLKGKMTGIGLAQHINRHHRVPFIYITAYSDSQIIEDVIHTRPAAFILKPFTAEEIRVAVEIALSHARNGKA